MKDTGWSIYPNLEKWIWMNCKSISDFAGRIGVAHKTVITLMKGERGKTEQKSGTESSGLVGSIYRSGL